MNQSYHTKVYLLLILLFITSFIANAQLSHRALFLGNSYTGVNNLPQLVRDVALSAGDTLIFDSYTPGGYRLIDHYGDSVSQNKIISGGWDYIVLQGQSQEPILDQGYFNSAGSALNNFITQYDACSVPMLYMTWGRKNGNATYCPAYPVMCTYEGMDTTLRNNYLSLASNLKAEVSPVSVVWNYLRQNFPGIELYQTDESHPSAAGSYAAACCFYATMFKKDPTLITFNFGLSAGDASIIRAAAKTQVYDHLNLWDFKISPESSFRYSIGPGLNEVIFAPLTPGRAETYFWDFGDGTTSTVSNPTHSYSTNGTYNVVLTTSYCDIQGLHISSSDTVIQFCSHTPIISTSGSLLCQSDTLWTQAADSYQWLYQEAPIPETNQYLANYFQYGIANFSVISTVAGCSELSYLFTEVPLWSGYYFDMTQSTDPCLGDTVAFWVLHINGFLSGSEIIQWYKNGTAIPSAANDDTLFITNGGTYECKLVNPNSNCPTDTTSFSIEFDCSTIGVEEINENASWSLFPNPSSEFVSCKFAEEYNADYILFYDMTGRLTKVTPSSSRGNVNISDLPDGIYFVRLKNNPLQTLKLIKQ